MCSTCDEIALDDMLARCASSIDHDGFALQGSTDASGNPDRPGWIYTIGLIVHADHPELIVAGAPIETSAHLLHSLATTVLECKDRFEVGDTIEIGSEVVHFGAVHPIQYRRDTFARWHDLDARGELGERPLNALQVFTPRGWVIARRPQPVLAHPWVRVDGNQPRGRSRPRAG